LCYGMVCLFACSSIFLLAPMLLLSVLIVMLIVMFAIECILVLNRIPILTYSSYTYTYTYLLPIPITPTPTPTPTLTTPSTTPYYRAVLGRERYGGVG
jgi:hypothetical protein